MGGGKSLERVKDFSWVTLPIEEYETLSGFLIGQLGRIPGEDEKPIIGLTDWYSKLKRWKKKGYQKVKAYKA